MKKLIALVLSVVMLFTTITPVYAESIASNTEQSIPKTRVATDYTLFSANPEKDIDVFCTSTEVKGSVYSGRNFKYFGSLLNVDEAIDAVNDISVIAWSQVNEKNTKITLVAMPQWGTLVTHMAQPATTYATSKTFEADTITIDKSINCRENLTFNGTQLKGTGYVISRYDITCNVAELNANSDDKVVMYSEEGNIYIKGSDVVINGILYAPKGKVVFNGSSLTVNGRIFADSIELNGSRFNFKGSPEDLDLIIKGVKKIYTLDSCFDEGIYDNVDTAIPNQLALSQKADAESQNSVKEYFNAQNNNGIKITETIDKAILNPNDEKVNINFSFNGVGTADYSEDVIDLVIVVDHSGSMRGERMENAKKAAKEVVAHLRSNDRCALVTFTSLATCQQNLTNDRDLLNQSIDRWAANGATDIARGLNEAIKVLDGANRDSKKYIILVSDGEGDLNAVKSAQVAEEKGIRIFSMTIGNGQALMQNIAATSNGIYKNSPTAAEIGQIMDSFVTEIFDTAARNATFTTTLISKDLVDVSAISPKPSKVKENADGSLTLEWNIERIKIDESEEINLPIKLEEDIGGFKDILRDTSCVYYNREGKATVLYGEDVSLPISRYCDKGSWNAVYDSGIDNIEWENIYWNGLLNGDSTIEVYASCSDDGVTFSVPRKIDNHKSFTGLNGRYLNLTVNMTLSSDGLSPELYDITAISKDFDDYTYTNKQPQVDIKAKTLAYVGVPFSIRAKTSDDCYESKPIITWSTNDATAVVSDTGALITSVIFNSEGTYNLSCRVNDGTKISEKTVEIEVVPPTTYEDIAPEVEQDPTPKIEVTVPETTDPGKIVRGKITNIGTTEPAWYSAIVDNKIAATIEPDGTFYFTANKYDTTMKLVVKAISWTGKSDTKEFDIVVSGSLPTVLVEASQAQVQQGGASPVFTVRTTMKDKLSSLVYDVNGQAVEVDENMQYALPTDKAGKFTFTATATTTNGNVIKSSETIEVVSNDREAPDVWIEFDKEVYYDGDTVAATVKATDNVGIDRIELYHNDVLLPLDANNTIVLPNVKAEPQKLTATAWDTTGNSGTREYTVVITTTVIEGDTTQPSLTVEFDREVVYTGQTLTISALATDDSGEAEVSVTVNGEALEADENGEFKFTPAESGVYEIIVMASDKAGNSVGEVYTFTVADRADTELPVLEAELDCSSISIGQTVNVNISASDDSGAVEVTAELNEQQLEVTDNSTSFTVNEAGDYTLVIRAKDATGNYAEQTFNFKVTDGEELLPPAMKIEISPKQITIDEPVTIRVTGIEDTENTAVTVTVNGSETVLNADLSAVFTPSEFGDYEIVVTAQTPNGAFVNQTVTLTIQEAGSQGDNIAPTVTASVTPATVKCGETVYITAEAQDNGGEVTVTAFVGETELSFKDGAAEFVPEKAGVYTITIIAKDSSGNEARTFYNVKAVSDDADGGTPAIVLNINDNAEVFEIGEAISVTVSASAPKGVKSLQLFVNDKQIEIAEDGTAQFTPEKIGRYRVKVVAEDNEGNKNTKEKKITVIDSSSLLVPGFSMSSPADGDVLTEPCDIVGGVSSDGLIDYVIEYSPAGKNMYQKLAEGTEAVANDVLARFDTTMLENGLYDIRTTVNGSTQSEQQVITVSVEGQMKIGNYSVAFQDMEVPVQSWPLTVVRSYDSRTRNESGDFGYGWQLSMSGLKLQESCVQGEYWKTIKSGGLLPKYAITETKKHIVTVNWGNGKTEKFKMVVSPASSIYQTSYDISVSYEGLDNTTSTLEPIGTSTGLINNSDGLYSVEGNVYNPQKYKLTTETGEVYVIDKDNGVETITDNNGNVITFGENGVIHSDGKSIEFTRDENGRIVKISSPVGEVNYAYSQAGDLISVTDAAGYVTSFAYDNNHYLTDITDPRGIKAAHNEYDENGRLIAAVDAEGNRIEISSDLEGRLQTVTDRMGNTTVYAYDNRGNIISETDPMGNTQYSEYDEHGNLKSKTDAMGNKTLYNYTPDGKLISVTAADGKTVTNTYNQQGMITAINSMGTDYVVIDYDDYLNIKSTVDAMGNEINYEYDTKGRVTSVTDKLGEYCQFTYNGDGNVVSSTNANGETVQYSYNDEGRCVGRTINVTTSAGVVAVSEKYVYDKAGHVSQIIYSNGAVTKTEYNSIGKLAFATDELGRRTSYNYDAYGNLVKITYPDNTFETFTYDKEGRNLTATDRAGHTVTMEYDKAGRLTARKNAGGAVTRYSYDPCGRVTEILGANGGATKYTYDACGRTTSVTNALGNTVNYAYNEVSQLETITDAKGNKYSYEYDKNGNRIKVVNPDGSYSLTEYDARGNIISETDPDGVKVIYNYDGMGRLVSFGGEIGKGFTYSYNELGLLTQVKQNSYATKYEYDSVGRLVKETNAQNRSASYAYDDAGNLLAYTDFNGTQISYAYDSMNRLIVKIVDSLKTYYSYTDDGRLAEAVDLSGATAYEYNANGMVTKKTLPDGRELGYEYDEADRLTKLVTPYGSIGYEYDLLNRITKVTDPDGNQTKYSYDANGNKIKTTYANGLTVNCEYDGQNRKIKQETIDNKGVVVSSYSYTYSKGGKLIKAEEPERTVEYIYDTKGFLKTEKVIKGNSIYQTTYNYDAYNRRSVISTYDGRTSTSRGIQYDSLNRPTVTGNTRYRYDYNGNLTFTGTDYNGYNGIAYTYNGENRPVSATKMQNKVAVETETYRYDYENNLISKTTNGVTTEYLLETVNGLTQVIAETTDGELTAFYTRGDELISMNRGGETSTYLFDGQGSVRMLADENGSVTDTYTYDAYGNLTEKTGETQNNYMYCGEQFNSYTGLYNLRARQMDPGLGIFTTADEYSGDIYNPVTLNKYMYANADPITYKDPSGYYSLPEANLVMVLESALAGGFISLGLGYVTDALKKECRPAWQHALDFVLGFAAGASFGALGFAAIYTESAILFKVLAGFSFAGGIGSALIGYQEVKNGNNELGLFYGLLSIASFILGARLYNTGAVLAAKDVANGQKGILTGELDGLTTAEKTMVDDLLNTGNNVEIIPRSNVPGNKTPDFLINGVKTELKTLTGKSLNTPVTRIQDGFKQGAETVIIDGRNTGLTLNDANIVLARALGKYGGGLPGKIEIWTTEGILRW